MGGCGDDKGVGGGGRGVRGGDGMRGGGVVSGYSGSKQQLRHNLQLF